MRKAFNPSYDSHEVDLELSGLHPGLAPQAQYPPTKPPAISSSALTTLSGLVKGTRSKKQKTT